MYINVDLYLIWEYQIISTQDLHCNIINYSDRILKNEDKEFDPQVVPCLCYWSKVIFYLK